MASKRHFNNAAMHVDNAAKKRVPQAVLDRLFRATQHGDVREVREVITLNPEALEGRLHGKTALLVAVEKNQFQSLHTLLEAKADPNAMSDDGKSSPVIAAVAADNTLMLITLIHKGAKLNPQNAFDRTPLQAAIESESLKSIAILLQHGASHKIFDDEGNAPLHAATSARRLKAAKTLLQNGAGIDQPNRDSLTPLMLAAQENNLAAAAFLVENGAALGPVSDLRETAHDIARAFPGKGDKFLQGFEQILSARLKKETREYLPDFRKGTKEQLTVKKPARFRHK